MDKKWLLAVLLGEISPGKIGPVNIGVSETYQFDDVCSCKECREIKAEVGRE